MAGEKKKLQKLHFFGHFLCFFENRIFRWEWANRREKLMKAPYRIFYSPNVLKKWSQNGTNFFLDGFWSKKRRLRQRRQPKKMVSGL